MSSIKGYGKANTQSTMGDDVKQEQLAMSAELQRDLEAQKAELENSSDYLSHLSMADQAKHAATIKMIDAELTLLENHDTLIEEGKYPDGSEVDFGEVEDILSGMPTGWNDMSGSVNIQQMASDKSKVKGKYGGTIMLQNTGFDPDAPDASNALAFIADDNVASVKGRTVGKDIHVEITYKDGDSEVFVLKNMAVRPEDIFIYAGANQEAITIDFSETVRISDGNWGSPFGDMARIVAYGGAGNDRIILSQGHDVAAGNGGKDTIFGLGGKDLIWGDGMAGYSEDDDNDTIDGGAGIDTIEAGGGDNDKVMNAKGDGVSGHENPGSTELYEHVAPSTFVTSPGVNLTMDDYKHDALVIQGDELTGDLNIKMPNGYTMATAEMDNNGQALVITMIGFGANGDAHTLKIKVNGFFDPKNNVHLKFEGNGLNNIIDFHKVTLAGGASLDVQGGDADDVIIGPKTFLDTIGLPLDELGSSTVSNTALEDIAQDMRHYNEWTDQDGKTHKVWLMAGGMKDKPVDGGMDEGEFAWVDFDNENNASFVNETTGEIVLDAGGKDPGSLNFEYPDGFTQNVVIKDTNGDLLLVFIKQTPDGHEQAVVRITGLPDNADTYVSVNSMPANRINKFTTVTGGGGYDTVFASETSVKSTGEEQIKGTYLYDPEIAMGDNASPMDTWKTLTEAISELEQERAELEDDLANEGDEEEQAKINKAIVKLTGQINTKKAEKLKLEEKHNIDPSKVPGDNA